MSKTTVIFIISALLAFCGLAQQTNKFSFESGALINKPLIKEMRITSYNQFTSTYDLINKYYTSAGYFFKVSYEGKIYSKNKWALFLPIGISYLNQTYKNSTEGYSWGCFGGGYLNEFYISTNRIVNLNFGTSLQYQNKKWRFTSSLILNNCLMAYSKTKYITPYYSGVIQNENNFIDFSLYASSQFVALFQLRKNIWLGPSCEVFFNNVGCSIITVRQELKGSYYENTSSPLSITGKNIWINPGLKLQIDLKYGS